MRSPLSATELSGGFIFMDLGLETQDHFMWTKYSH